MSACTVVRQTRPVVKIGLVAPFEGPYHYVGYDAIYAARLALRDANTSGGVGGYSVELVAYDDRGTRDGARVAARNLAQDPRVVAVIGHFRHATTEAARELYDEVGLPLIVAGTVEGVTEGEVDLFCPLLRYLKTAFDVQTVGVFPTDEMAPACAAGGPALVSDVTIPPSPGVDALLLDLGPVAAGETVLALREAGWEGVIAGGPTLGSPLFRQVAGEAAADVVFVADIVFVAPYRWPEVDGEDATFSEAYRAVGPHVPPPGPFALTTFQAVQSVLAAIEERTPTRDALRALRANLDQPVSSVYFYHWTASGTLERISP